MMKMKAFEADTERNLKTASTIAFTCFFFISGLSDGWKTEVPEDIQTRVDEMINRELNDTDLCFE